MPPPRVDELENAIEGGDHIIGHLRFMVGDFDPRTPAWAFTIDNHTL
jgi:hypothetical protein